MNKRLAFTLAAAALSLQVSGCGEPSANPPDRDTEDTPRETTDGATNEDRSDGALSEEQAEQLERDFARSDLQLTITGPTEPLVPGGVYEFTLTVNELDSNSVYGTTVSLMTTGLEYAGALEGCHPDSTGVSCLVPQGPDPEDWGEVYRPEGPGELVVLFRVTSAGETATLEGTVTSHNNGLDSDPDPSNNTFTLTLSVAAAATTDAPTSTMQTPPTTRQPSSSTSTAGP